MEYGMSIENVVSTFVEAMLPRFSDHEKVLVMSVEFRMNEFETETEFYRCLDLAFHRPSSYTKVFTTIKDSLRRRIEDNKWEMVCDHDSCWRSAVGECAQAVFDECRSFFDEHGIEMKDVHSYISFSIFGGKPHFRKATVDRDPNCAHGYKKILTLGEKV